MFTFTFESRSVCSSVCVCFPETWEVLGHGHNTVWWDSFLMKYAQINIKTMFKPLAKQTNKQVKVPQRDRKQWIWDVKLLKTYKQQRQTEKNNNKDKNRKSKKHKTTQNRPRRETKKLQNDYRGIKSDHTKTQNNNKSTQTGLLVPYRRGGGPVRGVCDYCVSKPLSPVFPRYELQLWSIFYHIYHTHNTTTNLGWLW